jgi:hypothetical protein
MNRKHAALAVAAAAVLSAPVFAQSTLCDASATSCTTTTTTILGAGPVMSSNGAVINSGTGVIVGQGAPSTSVTVLPSSVAMTTVPSNRLLPGAAQLQASQTTVLGGPAAGGVTGSTTVVTNYWVNVPANAERRGDFQRWLSLKP